MKAPSALYIVATPLGNLSDFTFRAVEVLKTVDLIAAEDTRHSAKLLHHYSIEAPLVSYHDHSTEKEIDQLLSSLEQGKSVALISDAGTPLISDPGYRLVCEARRRSIDVIPIPGCSALIAALSASGLPSDKFSFEGFPSHKTVARTKQFADRAKDERTLIYYESPHRIVESLSDMLQVFGESRGVVVAREISKTFETFLTGELLTVLQQVADDKHQQRGEIVILVHGYRKMPDEGVSDQGQKWMNLLVRELPVKKAAHLVSQMTEDSKNALYQWAIRQRDQG